MSKTSPLTMTVGMFFLVLNDWLADFHRVGMVIPVKRIKIAIPVNPMTNKMNIRAACPAKRKIPKNNESLKNMPGCKLNHLLSIL